ncbi:hypothetical protein PPERSA_00060 [Pseudocohnilembus persalinus]|uniref:Uncharacterized protein n=1 Tax=Pseudocohnilembus persalinus TaxID=266149 RepID=A0A0V0Q8I5_PSEPJ|nr:hypothetical protein PPERSA_00060 [Pseudocohnilembus persalinus]|eukprot:KRW98568.1 hypothetical protein PPERSA_00060 [Pseudocohnilembus persalinus]
MENLIQDIQLQKPDNYSKEKQILEKIQDFLKINLEQNQSEENLNNAIKISNAHFWLFIYGEQIAKIYFNQQTLENKLQNMDMLLPNQIFMDNNYGPLENRANLVIEIFSDIILQNVDQSIFLLQEQTEGHDQFSVPSIEFASNIFEDLNLFMIFPDLNIPQSVQEIKMAFQKKLFELKEEGIQEMVRIYLTSGWEFYKKNLLKIMENPQILQNYHIQKQLYTGTGGECYPAQKKNQIAQKILF